MTTVLITNDDGIDSPGLHALAAAAFAEGLDVVVAAPATESSGSSAAILGAEADGRIHMDRREIAGLTMPCYAVRAAPALITLIAAHGAFGAPPDAVLSGVNRGANVGRAVLHSGTVGAALTAGSNGARGLAVSLDVGMHPSVCHWDAAASVARSVLGALLDAPAGTVLNLNVPNDAVVSTLREAPLAVFGIVQTTAAEHGEGEVRLTVADLAGERDELSDAAVLGEGHPTLTSITAIRDAPMPSGVRVD
jgi:5'-nucleotidase